MAKIHKSITINAPVERVFDYASHPENLPEIWPSMVEVKNPQRKEDGSHSFDWVYKMAGVHFRGHSDTVEVEKNKHLKLKSTEGIQNTFDWSYSGENGTTRVEMSVDYSVPVPLLGKLAEPFVAKLNEREAQTVLENLKARLESGA